MSINITRELAVELFTALGLNAAAKWNKQRLETKLAKVNEIVDEDTRLEGDTDKTLTTVLKAIESGDKIEIDDGKGGAQPQPQPATDSGKGSDQPAANASPLTGVRLADTRPYLAGRIIARHGMEQGVTDEMVAELDEAYPRPNPRESKFTLRNAYHAIRGYGDQTGTGK